MDEQHKAYVRYVRIFPRYTFALVLVDLFSMHLIRYTLYTFVFPFIYTFFLLPWCKGSVLLQPKCVL